MRRPEETVRIDCGFHDHPKARDVGTRGRDFFIALVCYSQRYQTDGRVPQNMLSVLASKCDVTDPKKQNLLVGRLVDVGLVSTSESGWVIHDFLDWNPSKAETARLSKLRAQAGKKSGKARRTKARTKARTNVQTNERTNERTRAEQSPSDRVRSSSASPAPALRSKNLKSKSKAKIKPTTAADRFSVPRDRAVARWTEVYGRSPAWTGVEFGQLKTGAKKLGEEFLRVWDAYLSTDEEYLVKACHPPRLFTRDLERWRSETSPVEPTPEPTPDDDETPSPEDVMVFRHIDRVASKELTVDAEMWAKTLRIARERLSEALVDTWLRPLRYVGSVVESLDGSGPAKGSERGRYTDYLVAPRRDVRDWIRKHEKEWRRAMGHSLPWRIVDLDAYRVWRETR